MHAVAKKSVDDCKKKIVFSSSSFLLFLLPDEPLS